MKPLCILFHPSDVTNNKISKVIGMVTLYIQTFIETDSKYMDTHAL